MTGGSTLQGVRSGLLVVRGIPLGAAALRAAAAAAPWRGAPARPIVVGDTTIVGFGDAWIWPGRPLVALHGRIDVVDGVETEGAPREEIGRLLARALAGDRRPACDEVVGDYALLAVDGDGGVRALRSWVGTRPAYWARPHSGALVLASEPGMVLACLPGRGEIDHAVLDAYASYDDPADPHATFHRGVRAVPPSGHLHATGGGVEIAVAAPVAVPLRMGRDAAAVALRRVIDRAVRRRVAGAASVAGEVSGGMDSTSVMATATAVAAAAGAAPPRAFTLAIPAAPTSDEQDYARQVAAFLGIPLTVVTMTTGDARGWPEEAFPTMGPSHPTAVLSARTVRAAARAGADVLLTGQGGDAVIEPPGTEVEAALAAGDPVLAARWVAHWARAEPRYAAHSVKAYAWRRLGLRPPRPGALEWPAHDWWMRLMTEHEERLGAALGIRVEHPLLDLDVARLMAGLPVATCWWPPLTKALLRRAMEDALPRAVLARPDKTGFDDYLVAAGLGETGDAAAVYAAAWCRIWTFGGGA